MKRLLAIVQPNGDGFRGYVPRLSGCEVVGTTEEETSANVTAAVQKRLTESPVDGMKPEEVEVIVAVEAPPPPRPRADGLDKYYDLMRQQEKPEDLEWFLHLEEYEWITFEELMSGLGFDAEEPAAGEAPE